MINISQAVEDLFQQDDVALAAARKGWLNLSSYARHIQPRIRAALMKDVQEGSIVTALSRLVANLPPDADESGSGIQSLSVHANLAGLTYERSEQMSARTREIYRRVNVDNKTFLTVTQGLNEITIVAEARVARVFRESLPGAHKIYDKQDLVGITAKFHIGNLEVPNLIFSLTARLAYRRINLVEVVSTATELTFIIEKNDLAAALEQLQKDI